ncbi:hypothetical protein BC834DRAFT_966412 [Gloeopeniophorella convolvens]|nr:hypothetical protein BC834DRAFT_966412 [Gloeopeniophorella convolvens]
MIEPETWKVELPNGEIQASRTQYPLILSWAMSIHKSQGQTLDRVKVDLGKVFEKGQAIPSKVFVHEKVKQWSSTLETLEDPSSTSVAAPAAIDVDEYDSDVVEL